MSAENAAGRYARLAMLVAGCLLAVPALPARLLAQGKASSAKDPFEGMGATGNPAASAAVVTAIEQASTDAALVSEAVAARERLDRSLQALSDQMAERFRGGEMQRIAAEIEQSGDAGRRAAESLAPYSQIRGDMRPEEFRAMDAASQAANRALGVDAVSASFQQEIEGLNVRVQNMVDKELERAIKALEANAATDPRLVPPK